MDDHERLLAFDAFARGVREDLARITEQMDELKAQSKVKTVTYRQLFASRITLKEIDRRLTDQGL